MDSADSVTLEELAPWKRTRFRDYELLWVKAVESLETDHPLIELKSNKKGSRWTVYDKNTNKIAIFCYAGVWLQASPPQSGNFVPPGESSPPGLPEGRITSVLDYTAELSYTIDTSQDPSFYDAARIMEDHVTSQPNFNLHNKPRRSWQEARTDMRINSILGWNQHCLPKRKTNDTQSRPAVYRRLYGRTYFAANDIVWFSFALTYNISSSSWQPNFKPLDFIRVGRLSTQPKVETVVEHSVEQEVGAAYQALSEGNVVLLEGNSPSKATKRRRDSDGDDTMSDGALSDLSEKSAFSATQTTIKRAKLNAPDPKHAAKSEDASKRKAGGKGKNKMV
ncbi:hypothetical protein C8R43DRAFT_963517 [Mycena crocata]|nr:hypothetical protein C8R43DRAFT_963517 [Mycena crocata]